MTRGGLWLAASLLFTLPLDARCDGPGGETVVIQDASGRIVVVPAKAATEPERVVPVQPAAAAARAPVAPRAPARPAAPAREGAGACEEHDDLVRRWLDARKRVIAAQERIEAAESIPLSGMGGYRDARIAGAERELERAEARETEIDGQARNLGVPQRCFDDSSLPPSDD